MNSQQLRQLQGVLENKDLLTKILTSKEFNDLYSQMESTNIRFQDLPERQKRLALAIMMSGRGDMIPEMHSAVYWRKIPKIDDFLSYEYIPSVSHFYDKSKGSPWRSDLIKVFSPSNSILEWVLTGAIGTAKTSNALLAHFYNLYRINSLRNPQHTMGSDPGKSINLQLITIDLDKAKSLLFKMSTFLSGCPYYEEVGHIKELKGFNVREGEYIDKIPFWVGTRSIEFPNRIRVLTGSQASHALGDDLFGGMLDEAEFRGSVEQAMNLYSQILERIRSRFLSARLTLMTLVSSIQHETGIVAEHIKSAQVSSDSRVFVSQYPIWEVKSPLILKRGSFFVLRGNRRTPSRMLMDSEGVRARKGELTIPSGCKLIEIPNVYKKDFQRNVEQSMMDLAGEATVRDEKPFDELDHCEDPSLCPIFVIEAPLEGREPLLDQLPSMLLTKYPNGTRLTRYPDVLRYMHWDLADTGEAGVAMVHKEFSRDLNKPIFVLDFGAKIISPNRISFENVEKFGQALVDDLGINIHKLSADQYQSVSFLQKMELELVAREVERYSVDRTTIPYNVFSNIVSENSFRCGPMGELKVQLDNVYFHKGKPYSQIRKDIADAACGAVNHAAENINDIPQNVFEIDKIDVREFLPKKYRVL